MQEVFDRRLIRHRRARTAKDFQNFSFLLDDVRERLNERLSLIKRDFPVRLDADTPLIFDEEALPFGEASLDAVVSNLTLQWVNDLPGALLQIRNALKPDGLFLTAMIGGESLHELRTSLMEAELKVSGGVSPRVSPFIDPRDLGALLQRAGFALPVVDSDTITVYYSDMFRLMRDLRGMAATNATHNRRRNFTRRALFMEAAKIYAEKYAGADGLIPATFHVVYAIGWAPHQSQQQPLKPGSGKISLKEILS